MEKCLTRKGYGRQTGAQVSQALVIHSSSKEVTGHRWVQTEAQPVLIWCESGLEKSQPWRKSKQSQGGSHQQAGRKARVSREQRGKVFPWSRGETIGWMSESTEEDVAGNMGLIGFLVQSYFKVLWGGENRV